MTRDSINFDHVAITVSDVERSMRFYHDRLGLPVCDDVRAASGDLPFVSLAVGNGLLALYPRERSEVAVDDTEHICLALPSDAEGARQALENVVSEFSSAGIEVEGEPKRKYGAEGMGWSLTVRDPDGRMVELKVY